MADGELTIELSVWLLCS